MSYQKIVTRAAAVVACSLALAGSAHATRITGIGNASVDDVTLGTGAGAQADALAYSDENPAAGPAGNTGGFSTAFSNASFGTGAWSLLGKFDSGGLGDVGGDLFSFGFNVGNGQTGTWSLTNNGSQDVLLDLTFAMHASNASTAFLFDEQKLLAGQTLQGSWRIEWLKNGNIPGFSNLALFAREVAYTPPVPAPGASLPIPEPSSWAMLLTGLGLVGLVRRRRAAPSFTAK